MGDATKGTLDNLKDWYFITEADCVDSMDTLSELFDADTEASNASNLIDDLDVVDEGNSLALFNEQVREECDKAITDLKRKFIASPERSVEELSPRLQAVQITPQRLSKRRLFRDSGIEDETPDINVQVEPLENTVAGKSDYANEVKLILQSSNARATLLYKFKEKFNVSFCELTRAFKSNRTCTHNWIVAAFAVAEELIEASKIILQQHCDFVQVIPADFAALYLLECKSTKSRETIVKLFSNILNAQECQLLCEPPKNRSVATALFFFKKSIANIGFKSGDFPQWISTLTMVDHQMASSETFQLSEMIQWCYDNNYLDEAAAAYNYALYAEENKNAEAFLKCNQQVKYVKDACAMARLYKRQEQRNMSMSKWIRKCCQDVGDPENDKWKEIVKLLKYQNINFLSFMISLKQLLKGVPKKSCIVIYGPSDTGKSYFCFALVKFLKGAIVSYMNKNSHFWITPLLEAKVGFLDDATQACWTFLDINMRNAFDGNLVSMDIKHKNLQQIKLPPMFMTTNVDVTKEPSYSYLVSRLSCFEFPNKLPVDNSGNPLYDISTETWAVFFRKFARQLELTEEEADGDAGNIDRPFCCTARSTVEPN